MSFNLPFATSEITIGSDKNKIFISNTGDMVFVDGSLDGTELEGGVTLSQLAKLEESITLDDLIDISDVEQNKSYLLYRQPDDSWKAVEFIPPETTVENLNDIQDVNAPSPSNGDVLTFMNGLWRNVPKSTTIVIQVEAADWDSSATVIEGDPGYSVTVPHSLGLDLPAELLDVGIWNTDNTAITLHKVKQNSNNVYLESTDALDLYITMRKT